MEQQRQKYVAAGAGVAGVGCACCRQPIALGDMITDQQVMKGGELAYIELVHQHCNTARTVIIQECAETWEVISGTASVSCRSAMGALALVKKQDADLAMATGRKVVSVVAWHVSSDIGARAVKIVAGLR